MVCLRKLNASPYFSVHIFTVLSAPTQDRLTRAHLLCLVCVMVLHGHSSFGCRERANRLEAELAQAQLELAEVAVQEEAMRAEEDDYWRRYDALCLDLHVRPWPPRAITAVKSSVQASVQECVVNCYCVAEPGVVRRWIPAIDGLRCSCVVLAQDAAAPRSQSRAHCCEGMLIM